MKKILFNIMSVALCMGVLSACSETKKDVKVEVEKPVVKVATVTKQPVEHSEYFTATVEGYAVNNISSAAPTRIKRILVEVGDAVRKGQLLVEMDASNLLQAKSQLHNIQVEYDRLNELYKVGGATKSALDGQKMQLDMTRTSYQNLLENTQLVSPIDGVVTARNYDNGDMSGGAPVLTVEKIAPVKVKVNISESFYAQVKKGLPAQLTLDVYDNEVFDGKISLIYPTIDPQTRTFTVEITVPNANRKVRPGMFARVAIPFGTRTNVVVPDMAVIKQSGSGDRYIYVYKDGKVSYNKVEIGDRLKDKYEILSGVEANDQVVLTGHNQLNNGMAVEIDTTAVLK